MDHGYPMNQDYDMEAEYLPRRKRKDRRVWPWVLVTLAGLSVIACAGLSLFVVSSAGSGSGGTGGSDSAAVEQDDVSIVPGSCKKSDFGWEAQVKITNKGKTDKSYWVQVNLDKGTTRLGEAHAIVNNLKPGQTSTTKALGSGTIEKGSTCSVGEVN